MVVEITKKNYFQATMISILILGYKIVIYFYYLDLLLWPVYITIVNLNTKTCQSLKQVRTLVLVSIFIIYKPSKNTNNKDKNLKAKIYYMTIKIMLLYTYFSFFLLI